MEAPPSRPPPSLLSQSAPLLPSRGPQEARATPLLTERPILERAGDSGAFSSSSPAIETEPNRPPSPTWSTRTDNITPPSSSFSSFPSRPRLYLLGTRLQARLPTWPEFRFYPGKVVGINSVTGTLQILFDDGDLRDEVSLDNVCFTERRHHSSSSKPSTLGLSPGMEVEVAVDETRWACGTVLQQLPQPPNSYLVTVSCDGQTARRRVTRDRLRLFMPHSFINLDVEEELEVLVQKRWVRCRVAGFLENGTKVKLTVLPSGSATTTTTTPQSSSITSESRDESLLLPGSILTLNAKEVSRLRWPLVIAAPPPLETSAAEHVSQVEESTPMLLTMYERAHQPLKVGAEVLVTDKFGGALPRTGKPDSAQVSIINFPLPCDCTVESVTLRLAEPPAERCGAWQVILFERQSDVSPLTASSSPATTAHAHFTVAPGRGARATLTVDPDSRDVQECRLRGRPVNARAGQYLGLMNPRGRLNLAYTPDKKKPGESWGEKSVEVFYLMPRMVTFPFTGGPTREWHGRAGWFARVRVSPPARAADPDWGRWCVRDAAEAMHAPRELEAACWLLARLAKTGDDLAAGGPARTSLVICADRLLRSALPPFAPPAFDPSPLLELVSALCPPLPEERGVLQTLFRALKMRAAGMSRELPFYHKVVTCLLVLRRWEGITNEVGEGEVGRSRRREGGEEDRRRITTTVLELGTPRFSPAAVPFATYAVSGKSGELFLERISPSISASCTARRGDRVVRLDGASVEITDEETRFSLVNGPMAVDASSCLAVRPKGLRGETISDKDQVEYLSRLSHAMRIEFERRATTTTTDDYEEAEAELDEDGDWLENLARAAATVACAAQGRPPPISLVRPLVLARLRERANTEVRLRWTGTQLEREVYIPGASSLALTWSSFPGSRFGIGVAGEVQGGIIWGACGAPPPVERVLGDRVRIILASPPPSFDPLQAARADASRLLRLLPRTARGLGCFASTRDSRWRCHVACHEADASPCGQCSVRAPPANGEGREVRFDHTTGTWRCSSCEASESISSFSGSSASTTPCASCRLFPGSLACTRVPYAPPSSFSSPEAYSAYLRASLVPGVGVRVAVDALDAPDEDPEEEWEARIICLRASPHDDVALVDSPRWPPSSRALQVPLRRLRLMREEARVEDDDASDKERGPRQRGGEAEEEEETHPSSTRRERSEGRGGPTRSPSPPPSLQGSVLQREVFDSRELGPDVALSNGGSTVTRLRSVGWGTQRASRWLESGTTTITFAIERNASNHLFLGVVSPAFTDLRRRMTEEGSWAMRKDGTLHACGRVLGHWGEASASGELHHALQQPSQQQLSHSQAHSQRGGDLSPGASTTSTSGTPEPTSSSSSSSLRAPPVSLMTTGDRVTMVVDMERHRLAFYRGRQCVGEIFGLPAKVVPAVSFGGSNQIVTIVSSVMAPVANPASQPSSSSSNASASAIRGPPAAGGGTSSTSTATIALPPPPSYSALYRSALASPRSPPIREEHTVSLNLTVTGSFSHQSRALLRLDDESMRASSRSLMEGEGPALNRAMVSFVNARSTGMTMQQVLSSSWAHFSSPNPDGSAVGSEGWGDPETVALRFGALRELNSSIIAVLGYADFTTFHGVSSDSEDSEAETDPERRSPTPTQLATFVAGCASLIFDVIKRQLLEDALAASRTEHDQFELVLDYGRAAARRTDPRHTVFAQAFKQMRALPSSRLRMRGQLYRATMRGLRAHDDGGPYRQSFQTYCAELQSVPGVGLLLPCANRANDVHANRDRWVPHPAARDPTQLAMFEFLGQLMGVAVRNREHLDLRLAGMVWKSLVGAPLSREDLRAVDLITCNVIEGAEALTPEAFEAHAAGAEEEGEPFGARSLDGRWVDFSPAHQPGRLIRTHADLREWAAALERFKLHEFDTQVAAIRRGLGSVVPLRALALLTWEELELAVCGAPRVDLELLREMTVYAGCGEADPPVRWLWEVLEAFSEEQRCLYLRFVWGRSRLPVSREAWGEAPHKVALTEAGGDGALPRAHTCYFALDLPRYSSREVMRSRLLFAIESCSEIDADQTVVSNRSAALGFEVGEEEMVPAPHVESQIVTPSAVVQQSSSTRSVASRAASSRPVPGRHLPLTRLGSDREESHSSISSVSGEEEEDQEIDVEDEEEYDEEDAVAFVERQRLQQTTTTTNVRPHLARMLSRQVSFEAPLEDEEDLDDDGNEGEEEEEEEEEDDEYGRGSAASDDYDDDDDR